VKVLVKVLVKVGGKDAAKVVKPGKKFQVTQLNQAPAITDPGSETRHLSPLVPL
jgi:hypothetical protein